MDYKDYIQGTTQDHFWFKAKRQLIEILLSKIKAPLNMKILDIGAGTGDDIFILKKFGNIHVIDCNQRALDLIPDSMITEKKCGDACNLPYENNSFDAIVAFDVLEHIEDDHLAVAEIHRTLKPGGYFIFTVPAYQLLFSSHDKDLQHKRRYNKKNMRKLMKDFKSITLGFWLFFLFPCAVLLRLISKTTHHEKTPNKLLNAIMYATLTIENLLIKTGLRFPWGLTVYGIYQKPLD